MRQGQFQVRLRPCCGGAFTQLQLSGCVPTAIPPHLAKQLTESLTFWSGWPVLLALPAVIVELEIVIVVAVKFVTIAIAIVA